MVLKKMLSCSVCLLLLLLISSGLVDGRPLHLDTCSVDVHTHELHKYYTAIRADVLAGDTEIGITLLHKSLMGNVQEGQTCCFLHLLLRFYIERVFSNFAAAHPQQQRSASALANSFVSIKNDVHRCRCHCEEETRRLVDSVQAEFIKLSPGAGAHKAVGELDTVLQWLEQLSH